MRFFDSGGAKPVRTALAISGAALALVTIVLEVPAKFLTAVNDPVRYFLIGLLLNVLRILVLGAVTGLLCGRRRALPA